MKRNSNKKRNYYIILVVLLLSITLGFALLSTTLNINGLTGFKGMKWKVYWTNLQVESGSVNGTSEIVGEKDTTVEVNVEFEGANEYYAFTVDAKNDSTSDFDAMVDVYGMDFYSLVDGEYVKLDTIPSYITTSFTYDNGKQVRKNDPLRKGQTKKYRISVGIKDFDDASLLPSESLDLRFVFYANYKPADENINFTTGDLVDGATFYNRINEISLGSRVDYNTDGTHDNANVNSSGTNSAYNSEIVNIARSNILKAGLTDTNIVSSRDSDYVVYAWFDNGTMYLYTEAEKISFNSNSSYMFYNLDHLETIDFSGFDASNLTNANSMFENCQALKTIYVDQDSDWANITSSTNMFNGAYELVGGEGTEYDDSYHNGEYARIDKVGTPGYFTLKDNS